MWEQGRPSGIAMNDHAAEEGTGVLYPRGRECVSRPARRARLRVATSVHPALARVAGTAANGRPFERVRTTRSIPEGPIARVPRMTASTGALNGSMHHRGRVKVVTAV
jgi:hypothetical protein